MFETLPNPSLEVVLIAARALMLIGAFWVFAMAFIRWRRADEAMTATLSQQVERAYSEVRSLHETIAVMNSRIESLTDRADVGARLAPAGGGGSQRGYDIATRFAKNGADADELMANCGLTRHEAELLVRLHGAKMPEAAAPQKKATERDSSRTRAAQPESQDWSASTQTTVESARAAQAKASGRKRGSLLSVVS